MTRDPRPQGPSLSRRGATAPASPIRRLHPHSEFARARGVHVHHLNIGQPDLPTVAPMLAAYREFSAPVVEYSPSQGTLEYREALVGYYNSLELHGQAPLTVDQLLVTCGGSEALLFAIAAACDPGDAIVVAEPYYTNYRGFAHLLGVAVLPVETSVEDGFAIDPARVEAALKDSRVRALVLPSPGNPTGAVLTREELRALAELCRARDIFFIVDEVYREFVYPDDPDAVTTSPTILGVPNMDAHAIVIDSVSKRYSACGARIGCLVTRNAELYAACLKFAQARLSPPTVDQHAAMAALATSPAEMRAMIVAYRARRDLLVAGLRDIPGVRCPTPRGAFYLIADLPVDDAEDFCVFLLREFDLHGETVMMAPAEGFYATPGRGLSQVRIAYVLDLPKLERCLAILRAGLVAYAAKRAS